MYTNVVGCDQYGYTDTYATTENTTLTSYPPDSLQGVGQVRAQAAAVTSITPL
jgi:hypothetical protein